MDGSVLMLFEVYIQEKSPITLLIVRNTQKHFARRCHGDLFWEWKNFKMKEGASWHEDVVKESHKEKHRKHEK
jgi:hypothetical protein